MIHVQQTKLYDAGPPEYRGNCYAACVASVLEIPLEALPELHGSQDTGLNAWLAIHYPGIQVRSRDHPPALMADVFPTDWPWRTGYWLATVESTRFTEECRYHVVEGGEPLPPFWYDVAGCPHCGGSGERPGFHLVVCRGREIVHDPHPDAEGYGWEYVGRWCGETWFEVVDPSRLISRVLPVGGGLA